MQAHSIRVPKYRRHKAKDLAAVTIDGKHIYLGPYDSPESRERYQQEIARWLAAKAGVLPEPADSPPPASTLAVNHLVEAYFAFAEKYYTSRDGGQTAEFACIVSAMEPLVAAFGLTKVEEFGPKKLKLVREYMIGLGWSRGSINRAVSRIKRMFKWGVEEELFSPTIFHGLQAVGGLRFGRSTAKETEPVKPVAREHVEAIFPHVTTQVADMLRLLLLTGMRPGEVTAMRQCDIDRTGETWIYEPFQHKNRWRGHRRLVPLGPKSQAVLEKYLVRAHDEYLFSPAEADEERSRKRRAARKSPLTPSQAARKSKPNGKRRPTKRYDTAALRRAVGYGVDAANKQRREEEPEIPDWHPNQIRHAKATEIRRTYGLDGAQLALGHKHAAVTEIYAEKDLETAIRIASETG